MSAWLEMATGGHYNAGANQAWRDNFNGGWAAGDWTGNHNAQIAVERADAGERNSEVLANLPDGYRLDPNASPVNPNRGGYPVLGGSGGQGVSPSQSGGPKGPQVSQSPEVSASVRPNVGGAGTITGGGGKRPGGASSIGPGATWDDMVQMQPPMENVVEREVTSGIVFGLPYYANPWFSDVEKYWEPRGGEPGEWIGGILNTIIADPAYNILTYGGKGVEAVQNWDAEHGAAAGEAAAGWINGVFGGTVTPAQPEKEHWQSGGGGW